MDARAHVDFPTADAASAVTKTPPPASLPRMESRGSFVSARDSSFWVAVAVASASGPGSFSTASAASSTSGASLRGSVSGSALNLRAGMGDATSSSGSLTASRLARLASYHRSRSSDDHDIGLSIDVEQVDEDDEYGDGNEDDDDEEEKEEGEAKLEGLAVDDAGGRRCGSARRVAPITSPPAPSGGLRMPTRLLHKPRASTGSVALNRDRLGSDWKSVSAASTTLSERVSVTSPPPPRSLSPPPPPPRSPPALTIVGAFPLEVEQVYENQRYQMVLGWGSKGHLLPLDPGKFVRIVDSSEEHHATFPDVALPDAPSSSEKWEWASPWHLEYRLDSSGVNAEESEARGGDPDGWVYATNFHQFQSSDERTFDALTNSVVSSPSLNGRGRAHKLNVRRRKWIRYRRTRLLQPNDPGVRTPVDDGSAFDDSFLDSMCGWLRKLGHVRKNWKSRYFVLEKSILRYYADEGMTRLKGEVLLFHPAARVHYVDIHVTNGRDNTFAIQIGPEYTLLLQANRLSDRENWMYCIEDALLCRDSYHQDPEKTHDLRDSVARRRKFSSESMLFSSNGGSVGMNPVNMFMLHSKAVVLATRKNPLMMRLMLECDIFLESNEMKSQITAFIQRFKHKYAAGAYSNLSPAPKSGLSPRVSSVGRRSSASSRRHSFEGVRDDRDSGSGPSIHDPRSLLALKNYRFFLERSMEEVMGHLNHLPLAHASVDITSPRHASRTDGVSTVGVAEDSQGIRAQQYAPPQPGDIDWEMVKKATLYKLERQTFIPLQDIVYGLLETTVLQDDLAQFERNRRFLATQSQHVFEIQDSHVSPSEWKSAGALLNSMDNYSLPMEKASILLEVAKCIYDTYAKEHLVDIQMMAADDFLPIFIFILSRSDLRNVVVARHLISETMISCVMIGETGYYATMFEAAIGYIASFGMVDEGCDLRA